MRIGKEAAPLGEAEFQAITETLCAATRRMTSDQILDLADVLHEVIRTRNAMQHAGHGAVSSEQRSFAYL